VRTKVSFLLAVAFLAVLAAPAAGDPLPDGAIARLDTGLTEKPADRTSVVAVSFVRHGTAVLTADSSALCVWDSRSGKVRQRVLRPPGVRESEQIRTDSPDGRYLAVSREDRDLRVIDAVTGKEAFAGGLVPASLVCPGAFSRDGSLCVVGALGVK